MSFRVFPWQKAFRLTIFNMQLSNTAACMLTEAPADLPRKQLRELSIQVSFLKLRLKLFLATEIRGRTRKETQAYKMVTYHIY